MKVKIERAGAGGSKCMMSNVHYPNMKRDAMPGARDSARTPNANAKPPALEL